jgi:hypothetical protein
MANYERIEMIEIEEAKNAAGGQGIAAAENIAADLAYLRTQDESKIITFKASISYNSKTGEAQYFINIGTDNPQYFEFKPIFSNDFVKGKMTTGLSYNLPNQRAYSANILALGTKSNYLSKATIDLEIKYTCDVKTGPSGVNIDFGKGYWSCIWR